jgi:hypothetical protein
MLKIKAAVQIKIVLEAVGSRVLYSRVGLLGGTKLKALALYPSPNGLATVQRLLQCGKSYSFTFDTLCLSQFNLDVEWAP